MVHLALSIYLNSALYHLFPWQHKTSAGEGPCYFSMLVNVWGVCINQPTGQKLNKQAKRGIQMHFLLASLDRMEKPGENNSTNHSNQLLLWTSVHAEHPSYPGGMSSGCCLYPASCSHFTLTDRLLNWDRDIFPTSRKNSGLTFSHPATY